MSKNEILSREKVLEEKFNSSRIECKEISAFLMYFAAILQMGVEASLINQKERDRIANYISRAIDILTKGDDEFANNRIPFTNYLYVIALFLMLKPKWEAWKEVSSINSIIKAKEFALRAKKWVNFELNKMLIMLKITRKNLYKICQSNALNYYNELTNSVKEFMKFDQIGTMLNLRQCSSGLIHSGEFIFLVFEEKENYFETMKEAIKNFSMEVSILAAVEAKQVLDNKKKEFEEASDSQKKLVTEVNVFYEEQLKQISEEKSEKLNYYYNSLHRPGRKRKDATDDVEIEKDYNKKKAKIEKEWNEELKKLEKIQEGDKVNYIGESYSLYDLVKEFAIFGLAQKGVIQYPQTIGDRAEVLDAIKLKPAVDIFISMNRERLTEEQIRYLERV